MKRIIGILLLGAVAQSCQDQPAISSVDPVNWDGRKHKGALPDTLSRGATYLSIYSQIYSQSEQKILDLTATVSIRNTNRADTIYIEKTQYFGTKGDLIRTYFDQAIFVGPMETVAIVIDQADRTGGTGANFLFDWRVPPGANEPLFEGIMLSTYGQLGLSFTTQGVKVE